MDTSSAFEPSLSVATLTRVGRPLRNGLLSWSSRRQAGVRNALVTGLWLVNAACTVTADEFSPRLIGEESPGDAAGRSNTVGSNTRASDTTSRVANASAGGPLQADRGTASTESVAAPEEPAANAPAGGLLQADRGTASEEESIAALEEPAATAIVPLDDAEITPPPLLVSALEAPVGWASVAGRGVETTTGAGLTAPVLARTAEELVALAASPEPLTIGFQGTLDVGALQLTSNKTLIGLGSDATLLGGISIRGQANAFVENVIVANLNVSAATSLVDGDGIQIHHAHHVWIDHCALHDAPNGLLDIVHGSDFVTVSSSIFYYTPDAPEPAHRFATLVGDDALNVLEDRGVLNVTWHHNWWAEGVMEAMTGRYGGIHVFNNLFRSPGDDSVIRAGVDSSWLIESNRFADVAEPHTRLTLTASLIAIANVYDATTGSRDATAEGLAPPYEYALDSAIGLEASITAEAGPH
jgi:pectate lyase